MAVDICVRVGRRIQAMRAERAMYQVDLAEMAGLTRKSLSSIENGKAEPGLRTLAAIAKALDVSLVELLAGVE